MHEVAQNEFQECGFPFPTILLQRNKWAVRWQKHIDTMLVYLD